MLIPPESHLTAICHSEPVIHVRTLDHSLRSALALLMAVARARGEDVDYAREIKPLLTKRCYACHGALKQKANLRLDTAASIRQGGESGPAIEPGNADSSLIIGAVTGDIGFRMPPEGEGSAFTKDEIELLKRWIQQGAISPADELPQQDPRRYWSYQLVQRPRVPNVKNAEWMRNPIDAFISAGHEKIGVRPRPEADKATLVRRLYLDLIGIPPDRNQLQRFMSDKSPDAYERLVDELLDSPLYGQRWGRHWMDVWRYSDWYGYRGSNEIRYGQRHSWRWRDWIVESLNADKSYDQMVIEMLAGDEIAPGNPNIVRATGFLGRNWYKFDRNVWLFETVEQTSQAFLGLTMRCARCHDHKFDPIAQRDYYRLRAFFEPHEVRMDPISANLEMEKDATGGMVFKDGLSFVYDKQLDAPTYLFIRGDSRNPDQKEILSPGVPDSFHTALPEIQSVELPAISRYPMLRPEILEGLLATARASVAAAEAEQSQQQSAVDAARAKLDQVQAGTSSEDNSSENNNSEDKKSVVTFGSVLAEHFEQARPEVWRADGGQWQYADGHVAQTDIGAFRTLVSNVVHPADFMLRVRYKTTEPGAIHSVGVFFDTVELRDCQAVYTATNNATSSVQAFHRQAGVENYPGAGIVPWPIKLNEEVTLDLAARGDLLNVWVNGTLAIVYRMPMARQSGTLAIWTHAANAEFYELLCDPLPTDFVLAQQASEAITSPFTAPTADQFERRLAATQQQLAVSDRKLSVARADLVALEARIAADEGAAQQMPDSEARAKVAARSEREAKVAAGKLRVLQAEQQLHATSAVTVADEQAKQKMVTEAQDKLKTAQQSLEEARAAVNEDDASYTSLGPAYPRTTSGRRLALARWIADPNNPRTAHVAVNHMWLRHFGEAIVTSPSNFGLNGRLPSHPELLDWLAAELTEHRWSMKHLHRLMVTSATYRLATSEGPDPTNVAADPTNVYLWRMNSRRIESEVVRDSLLSIAHELDFTFGGAELAESEGLTSRRRSLYYRSTPNEKMQFLELFDQANPNECYRRQESVVPQQSLALVNSVLVLNEARHLAAQLTAENGPLNERGTNDAFIMAAFEQTLSRAPTTEELAACRNFLIRQSQIVQNSQNTTFPAANVNVTPPATDPQQHARENLVHVLLNHNDFITVR